MNRLSKNDRISPAILQTELEHIKFLMHEWNFGYAIKSINQIVERMQNYDWGRLREVEKTWNSKIQKQI